MTKNAVKIYKRSLKLPKDNSFFLFGPRGTGKTSLLDTRLPQKQTFKIDLLDNESYYRFSTDRSLFKETITSLDEEIRWVYIDEIQKIPALLDEVHKFIESRVGLNFALTGSSARKLKAGNANLLAGRAFTLNLFTLSIDELGADFNLNNALRFGTLPKVFELNDEESKRDFLYAYINTYLQEEIMQESLTRNLNSFRNFLRVAAASNGEILSFSNIARESGVSYKDVKSYYEILEDTLIGYRLYPFRKSIRKKQREKPKFYFFDPGVVRALRQLTSVELPPHTFEYGNAFEHLLINEIIKENDYRKTDYQLSYFATPNSELDLIIEKPTGETILLEIKSSTDIQKHHLSTLRKLIPSVKGSRGILVCREPNKRRVEDKLLICPWQDLIEEIFDV